MDSLRHFLLVALAVTATACSDGTDTLDAQAASDLLVADVLSQHVPEGAPFVAIRVDRVLPEGAMIVPDGPPPPPGTADEDVRGSMVVHEPSHLFLVDLAPGTYFGHPVKYALVGESGAVRVTEASWLPAIDGVVPPELEEAEPNPDLVVSAEMPPVVRQGTTPIFDIAAWIDLIPNEGYIVVQGLMPTENLYPDSQKTANGGKAFFDAYAAGLSRVELLEEGDAAMVLDLMDEMAGEGRSPIVVAIIAHGGTDSIGLGGVWFSASDFARTIQNNSDTAFVVLLGSCRGGSFVDDLRAVPNVRVVGTAVGPLEGAKPDWDPYGWGGAYDDPNAEDVGSEWFSSFYRAASDILNDEYRMMLLGQLQSAFNAGQTEMLMCQSVFGAIGASPVLTHHTDFDSSHVLGEAFPDDYGTHTPQRHCAWH